jgi:hypothetical protein
MPGRQKRESNLNVRISEVGRHLMERLQEFYGLSQGSVIELLLRDDARRHSIPIPGSGADLARREEQQEEADRLAARAQAQTGRKPGGGGK